MIESAANIKHVDLIVCDLEATCWDDGTSKDQMETIEIGAVRIQNGVMADQFSSFIRPALHTKLSEFCKKLTTIHQADVDTAQPFAEVFNSFLQWIGPSPFVFCSWGRYDVGQLQLDTQRLNIPWPATLSHHLNIKHTFAQWRQVPSCGMDRALQYMNIPLEGVHHRGIDDARNIARLALMMLPWLLSTHPILIPVSMDSHPL